MNIWLKYLKQGLSRKQPRDPISGGNGYKNIKSGLTGLRAFVKPHFPKFIIGSCLIILSTLFTFPQPLITRFIVDDVILGRNLGFLMGAIFLLIGCASGAKLLRLLEEFYFARFEQKVLLTLQEDLIGRTFRFPKSFFDDNQTGYLMSRISSDAEELRWFFSSTIVYILSNILRFIGGAIFLFYLEWRLAIGVVVIIPVLVCVIRFFSGKIHVLSHQEMEQQAKVTSRFQEFLSAVSLVKAFSSEKNSTARLMSELKEKYEVSLEQITIGSITALIISLMPGIARVSVLAFGAFWIIKEQWTLGSLLAFQAYMGYVFGPTQYLASANIELQKALAALKRVSALFDIAPEEEMGSGKIIRRLKGDVEFKNVWFSYDNRQPALEDISFRITPGEKIAIIGPSGVGKTTLISLILRFYKPTGGEIYFDGEPASSYEVGSLRERIGYVSQRTLLLSGSVKENLCYGNPTAEENDVVQACKVAGCYDFIENLPGGFKTEIGENGIKLSEGQKQRLSLARALVKDPDVLILDEPTAALDSLAEKSIFDSIPDVIKNKTLFVVAHRFSTIRKSDRVFLLKENRLDAVGTHQQLIQESDYYRSMADYQQT